MADQVRINGFQIGWPSCKLTIDGETFTGYTAIGFGDAIEEEKGYGQGQAPRSRSPGRYVPEPLTITMWASSAQELRRQLAERSPTGAIGRAIVPIVLQYIEADDATITIEFEECRYLKSTSSNEEGPAGLKEDIEFSVMAIRRNGLVLFDERQA